MKVMFVLYGLVMAVIVRWSEQDPAVQVAKVFFWVMLTLGGVQLILNLVTSVRQVNARGAPPDTTAWELTGRGRDGEVRG